ncbi:MAG: NADH-quinone oxidoreductase subunit NuoE [Firmicutes bacterium]|jgi:NADH-quinone oxidoreductase subunit E|nr:NADH-quinone oxidoreductase subunit NuoE [Bacillota bacterium]
MSKQIDYFKPLDEIIGDNKGDASQLIPMLQKIQESYGYLPMDVIVEMSERTGIKVTDIMGVASFYAGFRLTPLGKYVVKICAGTACHVNGAETIAETICEELNVNLDETTEDGLFTVETVACLGCCSLAPVMMINGEVYGRLTRDKTKKILREYKELEGA